MASVEESLRIVPEFRPNEYDMVVELMSGKLDRRLTRWDPSDVELEISVKDRDTSKQHMAVECWIAKLPKIVATSNKVGIEPAVLECRDELHKQIDKYVTKKEAERRR